MSLPPKTGIVPPPPPPPPAAMKFPTSMAPQPPLVASPGPSGTFQVELLIYNGSPFKDHWAYWVRSRTNPDIGVKIHATGNVGNGFELEIKRCIDLQTTDERPTKRVPLQWVDGKYFDQNAMLNNGESKIDNKTVCRFEASAFEVKAPEKTLNVVGNAVESGKKIIQRDCQTWIVESADQIVKDNIFTAEVLNYLQKIEQ